MRDACNCTRGCALTAQSVEGCQPDDRASTCHLHLQVTSSCPACRRFPSKLSPLGVMAVTRPSHLQPLRTRSLRPAMSTRGRLPLRRQRTSTGLATTVAHAAQGPQARPHRTVSLQAVSAESTEPRHSRPKPSAFMIASLRRSSIFSRDKYSGRRRVLKHVCEVGNLSESGPSR